MTRFTGKISVLRNSKKSYSRSSLEDFLEVEDGEEVKANCQIISSTTNYLNTRI